MISKELLKTAKPILFNTEMVRAILERRKTATRRVVKPQPKAKLAYCFMGYRHVTWSYPNKDESFRLPDGLSDEDRKRHWTQPCHTGDILYVRETWQYMGSVSLDSRIADKYIYCADWNGETNPLAWRPSIHMPREAARIFLRVKDVWMERLQDIQERGPASAEKEGFINDIDLNFGTGASATKHFSECWNNTIKKSDLPRYGWDANPWVWVIEFEKAEVSKND